MVTIQQGRESAESEIPQRDDVSGYIEFCNTLFSLKEIDLHYMEGRIHD